MTCKYDCGVVFEHSHPDYPDLRHPRPVEKRCQKCRLEDNEGLCDTTSCVNYATSKAPHHCAYAEEGCECYAAGRIAGLTQAIESLPEEAKMDFGDTYKVWTHKGYNAYRQSAIERLIKIKGDSPDK